MKTKIYCIFDVIANEGGNVYVAKNDEVARRMLERIIPDVKVRNEHKLILLGSFETEELDLVPSKPEIVWLKGVEIEDDAE